MEEGATAQRPDPALITVPTKEAFKLPPLPSGIGSEFLPYKREVYGTWQERALKAAATRTPEQLAETAETPQGRHYWSCLVRWRREAPEELERLKASGLQEGTLDWEDRVCALWRSIFREGLEMYVPESQ